MAVANNPSEQTGKYRASPCTSSPAIIPSVTVMIAEVSPTLALIEATGTLHRLASSIRSF